MSSFLAADFYHPALVLAAGLLAFAGFSAAGAVASHACRLKLPAPWGQVVSVLLGIQVSSLAVQLLAMAGLASRAALVALAVALLGGGTIVAYRFAAGVLRSRMAPFKGPALLALGVSGLSVAVCLVAALAPSSKADEIYYHMLVPGRILSDGALRLYREPWEGAILPQMFYQIAATPLHAIRLPDAANVVSWMLGVCLAWFAWRIIREGDKPPAWAFLWTGSLFAGLYAVVWHVTAGSHAMGALALAAATVAFCLRERLIGQIGRVQFAALFSILALGAGSAKVTLLPVVALMLVFIGWRALQGACRNERPLIEAALVAPWALLFLPLVAWTWVMSGSPFGPMLSDFFPGSQYGPGWSADLWRDARADNEESLPRILLVALADYTPLLYFGMAGVLFAADLSKAIRTQVLFLLAFQGVVIATLLLPNMRYFGGLHYGLVIVFAACAKSRVVEILASSRSVAVTSMALLAPWVAIQIYYAHQFLPVVLGLQEKTAFYERYIAFYRDYVALDRLLPRDASLLIVEFRTANVYAPRPVYLEPDDLPDGGPLYVMTAREGIGTVEDILPAYRKGTLVYENAHAISAAYRTPGRPPQVQPIFVVEMVRH